MEPDAGVDNHAFYTVLTHQDAALRIIGIIAGMDADALKIGDTQQQRQPHLKPRRLADHHRISTLRYRRPALHLLRLLARYTPQPHILLGRTQLHTQNVAPARLQRITEIRVGIQLLRRYLAYRLQLPVLVHALNRALLHLLILQDIKATYRVGILLRYSFYNYLHKSK